MIIIGAMFSTLFSIVLTTFTLTSFDTWLGGFMAAVSIGFVIAAIAEYKFNKENI